MSLLPRHARGFLRVSDVTVTILELVYTGFIVLPQTVVQQLPLLSHFFRTAPDVREHLRESLFQTSVRGTTI